MEPEQVQPTQQSRKFANLRKVTPLSKYLAVILFIVLPFLGGYVGYVYAPEKVVEVSVLKDRKSEPSLDEGSQIYNWGKENRYASDQRGVYCLVDFGGKLKRNLVSGIDPASFQVLRDVYVKDAEGVYEILCPKSDEVYISRYEVSDPESFDVVSEVGTDGPNVFVDKNFVYFSLPQEFLVKKNEDIDRQTFEYLGFGREREVVGPEGVTWNARNYYFKDKDSIYVIDMVGRLMVLEVPVENFDIDDYESNF